MTSSIEADLGARARAALDEITDAARRAGEIAMRDFRLGEPTSADVHSKHGGSPVTAADLAVDHFLSERLGDAFPEAGWLSEETVDDPRRLEKTSLIVVDPIDGTRAYLAGDPRWAISIALVFDGRPIAGVIHAPAIGETYVAALGAGARLGGAPIHSAARAGLDAARVGGPKPMIVALAAVAGVELTAAPRVPSLALRLAHVASGALDIGLASANSHDWDIAAADVILAEAGARLVDERGKSLRYNNKTTRRGALLACGARLSAKLATAARLVLAERTA